MLQTEKARPICLTIIRNVFRTFCGHLKQHLLNKHDIASESNPQIINKMFILYSAKIEMKKKHPYFLSNDLKLSRDEYYVILCNIINVYQLDQESLGQPLTIMSSLFDHIAECLASFIKERELEAEILPLGFTFSFPCVQEGLTKARLERWTKGFKCAGVEGEDVVQLMKEAITRRGDVKIKICAVLNDTTGTLMSCAWKNRNCRVGLIVGTGVNACYMEKLDKVELWDGDYDHPEQVVINTEWGAFGDNGCLEHVRTQYDRNVDTESINPGRQLYEKMISGMYMGEVARQVLCRLVEEGLLFDGKGAEALLEKGSFYTKYISEIESDKAGDWNNARSILEELGINFATDADCANVRHVCECVSRRAAYLAGAGVALLLNRMGELNVTVAVDGSVFRFHPHFHRLMKQQIRKLANSNIKFDVMLSEDGSGRGAALVAAVAYR
ncbi:unnamed protein product, partial [Meganyctiphanes norvegica]